jgi:hypothetical protein
MPRNETEMNITSLRACASRVYMYLTQTHLQLHTHTDSFHVQVAMFTLRIYQTPLTGKPMTATKQRLSPGEVVLSTYWTADLHYKCDHRPLIMSVHALHHIQI